MSDNRETSGFPSFDDLLSYNIWQSPSLEPLLGSYKDKHEFNYDQMHEICAAFNEAFAESPIPLWKETGKFPSLSLDENEFKKSTLSQGHLAKFHTVLADAELKPTEISEEIMKENHGKCFEAFKEKAKEFERTPDSLLQNLNLLTIGKLASYERKKETREKEEGERTVSGSEPKEKFFQRQAINQVYDFVRGIVRYFFGPLATYETELPSLFGTMYLYPDLEVLGNNDFGNIITGEVKMPSIRRVVDLLKKKAIYLDMNFLGNKPRADGSKSQKEGEQQHDKKYLAMLAQLLGNMIMAKCLLGVLTDSIDYIFIVITSLNKVNSKMVIELDYYHTKAESKYVYRPANLSPREAMLSLLGVMMGPGPEDYRAKKDGVYQNFKEWIEDPYLNSLFGQESANENFEYFRTSRPTAVHCELIPKVYKRVQYEGDYNEEDYNSQVMFISADEFLNSCTNLREDWRNDLRDLSGIELAVKVFDPNIAFAAGDRSAYETVLYQLWKLYEDEMKAYGAIESWNLAHEEHHINAPKIFMSGYFSFWNTEKKGSGSYVASGPAIIMEKLTEKPKKKVHIEKGVTQLARLAAAGISHGDIKMDNMFMRGDDFVFIDYGLSKTKPIESLEQIIKPQGGHGDFAVSSDAPGRPESLLSQFTELSEYTSKAIEIHDDFRNDFDDYVKADWGHKIKDDNKRWLLSRYQRDFQLAIETKVAKILEMIKSKDTNTRKRQRK